MGVPRRRVTLMTEIGRMTQHLGFRDTVWVLQFLALWTKAVQANDWQPIDAEGYAAYWKLSRGKGFKDQRRWRELFPGEPTPNDRVVAARPYYEAAVSELGREPSPDELAAIWATQPAA